MGDGETGGLSPKDATRLRVTHRTRVEVLVEFGILDEDDLPASREQVREAAQQLTASESKTLHLRTRRRLRHLEELMEGDRETFAHPHATTDDLLPEVALS